MVATGQPLPGIALAKHDGVEAGPTFRLDAEDSAPTLAEVSEIHPRLQGLRAETLREGRRLHVPPAVEDQRTACRVCDANLTLLLVIYRLRFVLAAAIGNELPIV